MKRKRKRTGKKKILEGHKKVGSRFITPMKQIPLQTSYSYVNQMLPELIWIGLINDSIGYVSGARLLEKIFLAVEECKGKDIKGNFAYISSYRKLQVNEKEYLIRKLDSLGVLEDLRFYLAPLVLLYDEFPLRFIGPPSTVMTEPQIINKISCCVDKHVDKYDTPGIVLNGSSLLWRFVTKTIRYSADIDIPDFNSVISAPDSKEAKRAASHLRANALAEFAMLKISSTWARYFWNKGYEISPCEGYSEIESEE